MTEEGVIITPAIAVTIENAVDLRLGVSFHAGNSWQRYEYVPAVLRFQMYENYKWETRWTYNISKVKRTEGFLTFVTMEGNEIAFAIDKGAI